MPMAPEPMIAWSHDTIRFLLGAVEDEVLVAPTMGRFVGYHAARKKRASGSEFGFARHTKRQSRQSRAACAMLWLLETKFQ